MLINVIGLGYIGLPTAVIFASNGIKVIGVDVSTTVVDIINQGKIHIEEPGLAEMVKEVVKTKMLKASLLPTKADVFIISVPTPNIDDEYMGCNLKYVKSAVNSILPYLEKGNVVIIESTISPRATEDEIKPLFEEKGFTIGQDIFLAHCPERVLPGQILNELVTNNRIIGGITSKCSNKAAEIYKIFVKGEIIKTEAKIAEMSKLMENTYRDINIAIANELVKICNELNINALEVIEMANKHPRVNILNPGPGVGGHCLAVDPYFIYSKVPTIAQLIKKARDINDSMPNYIVSIVEKLLNYNKNKIIAVFGVAYKPNVDDIRESPSLAIVEMLIKKGYSVKVYDPYVKNANYFNETEAVKNSSLLLFLVAHDQFKTIDIKKIVSLMKEEQIFDVVNVLKSYNEKDIINYGNIHKFL